MKLYHGSEYIIENPEYHKGKRNNDYGYGFYCTEHIDVAKEWSVGLTHDGYVNTYELDDNDLTLLNLNDYCILTWLTILIDNRTFKVNTPLAREAVNYLKKEFSINYEKYDLIKGYRADDSYFAFANDFINGNISFSQLSDAMHLGDLGNQIVLYSQKSFKKIKWIESESVKKEIWYPKRQKRNDQAKKAYFSLDRKYIKEDLYITRIIDEEIKKDDVRIQ